MKKPWIKIALIASVALNLAFLSSGIYKTFRKERIPEPEAISFMDQYKLSDEQSRKLDEVVKQFRMKLAENKSDVLDKRIDIIEMLGDPSFKTEDLENGILELNGIEGELNIAFVSTLLEINRILDRDQWVKFLYNLGKSWFFSGFTETY